MSNHSVRELRAPEMILQQKQNTPLQRKKRTHKGCATAEAHTPKKERKEKGAKGKVK